MTINTDDSKLMIKRDTKDTQVRAASVNGAQAMRHWILGFAALCFLVIASVSLGVAPALAQEPDQEQGDAAWAEDVADNVIDFGGKKSRIAAKSALDEVRQISSEVQKLKEDVVLLNKDLRVMEETILFPSNTKYTVFLSTGAGQFFTLESVKLKVDGRLVATHLYSEQQRKALARGGIQNLYITNLSEGKHSATAFFTGVGPNGRAYKRATSLDFVKKGSSRYLEIAVKDNGSTQEPEFVLKQW